ncbi:MAG: hypothetical protein BMS9Abin28_1900 [Anaerolineae bacterium]|nr:MAG: hypothetical protein BMS9Abin28_1900 [Anaerolineae bacterium]
MSRSCGRDQISKGGDCPSPARNVLTHRINALEAQLGLRPNDQLQSKAAETPAQLDALAANQSLRYCPQAAILQRLAYGHGMATGSV